MKNALENSCLKGCLVYLVALVVVVLFSTVGLGGLSAKFGVGAKNAGPGATGLSAPKQQASPAQANATPLEGGTRVAQQTSVPAAPTSTPPAPAILIDSAPQVQAQGGTIMGEASTPFYIVQPGDTLWGIAITYGIKVEELRAANKLGEEFIKPGQLLYLPKPQAPAPVQDASPVQQGASAQP